MRFSKNLKIAIFAVVINILCAALARAQDYTEFYSKNGDEYAVSFKAVVISDFSTLEQTRNLSNLQRADFEEYTLKPLTKFIFGPLTNRQIGAEQKGFNYEVLWDHAILENGKVTLPYVYHGQWLISKSASLRGPFELPLPYSLKNLKTPNWKNCTDPSPDHQDFGSFWYFWDPNRYGCDHKLGKQYQTIKPELSSKTAQTTVTYPEYEKMVRNGKLSMTFAFGYVEDPASPQPFKDSDEGIYEFRSFIESTRRYLRPYNFSETAIFEKEYLGALQPDRQIGSRMLFEKNGVQIELKVVASGSIDQMELFAKSFSRDHDAFFGWFGHSRVGNGFDAMKFGSLLRQNRSYYSVTADYQLVYWAGCNSYSYYTKPFFDFKAQLRVDDANGTKSLDIISNGLPSFFSLNASNADVLMRAVVGFDQPVSFQAIVDRIEKQSNDGGTNVLVNVLGDEDN